LAIAEETLEQARTIVTTIAALYVHGPRPSMDGDTAPTPMIAVEYVDAIAGVGLQGVARHMRKPGPTGKENMRQVSMIDVATVARHRARFGDFPMEWVKSQLVLAGDVHLPDYLGREVIVGDGDDSVVLQLTIKRDPCEAMDLISPGLRAAMADGEQGALARVVRGGRITLGQKVTIR
jgi:hypothetical protein